MSDSLWASRCVSMLVHVDPATGLELGFEAVVVVGDLAEVAVSSVAILKQTVESVGESSVFDIQTDRDVRAAYHSCLAHVALVHLHSLSEQSGRS